MDVLQALDIFRTGSAKMGSYAITSAFFDLSKEEMIDILKKGYHPFSNDLFILVSALMGCGSVKITKMSNALKCICTGKTVEYEGDLFDGVNIAVITVAYDGKRFVGVGAPLTVLSIDGGKTWSGMIKTRCRTVPIEVWAGIYYSALLESIRFKPNMEFFLTDFRTIGVFVPGKKKFVITRLLCMDKRSILDIKQECISAFNSTPYYVDVDNRSFLTPPQTPEKIRLITTRSAPPPLPPKRYGTHSLVNRNQHRENTLSPKKSPRKSPKRLFQDEDSNEDVEDRTFKKQRTE